MQIIASVCVYFIALRVSHSGGMAPWRVIQFFLGGTTVLCGICDLLMIGTPKEVWWLNKQDKKIAHARVVSNASECKQNKCST